MRKTTKKVKKIKKTIEDYNRELTVLYRDVFPNKVFNFRCMSCAQSALEQDEKANMSDDDDVREYLEKKREKRKEKVFKKMMLK